MFTRRYYGDDRMSRLDVLHNAIDYAWWSLLRVSDAFMLHWWHLTPGVGYLDHARDVFVCVSCGECTPRGYLFINDCCQAAALRWRESRAIS